ncbi:MAG: hypothetical protein KDA25_09070, partial [Phycisphaerales bacterium]|nr:hypothetical protein [Phycisphaerales bacterium]
MSTEALFQLALDLDGAERRALLDRLEVEDAARHAEIVALMRHYDEAAGDGFLSGAAVDVAA